MDYTDIKTGYDLRKYIEILSNTRIKRLPNYCIYEWLPDIIYRLLQPSSLDYLLQLWTVIERYKDAEKVDFALIGKMLQEAFDAPKKQINKRELLKKGKVTECYSERNTPEYYEEIRTYLHCEARLHNHIIDLIVNKKEDWISTALISFFESTYYLEQDTEFDPNTSWFEVCAIIHSGLYD